MCVWVCEELISENKRIFYYISWKHPPKTLRNFILFILLCFFFYSYHPLIKTQNISRVWFWLLFLMMVVVLVVVVLWITLLVCCSSFFLCSISLGCLGNVCQCLKVFLSIINEEESTIGSSSLMSEHANANSRSTPMAQWH